MKVFKKPYSTGELPIDNEDTIKDLGIFLSDDLGCGAQISEAVKGGRKFMWWILRSFESRKAEILLFLYRSYVLPKLEYSSILWSPYI